MTKKLPVKDVKLGPADLKDGELRGYEVGRRFVLVTRLGSELFAIDDQCNHAGCLLSSGWLDGRAVVCPCHEHSFDATNGKNVTEPRLCEDQQPFPLRVVDGEIVVALSQELP
jgi:3-phenylpropionate/trans-cinnamate dioxygenase ferredoxin subunit